MDEKDIYMAKCLTDILQRIGRIKKSMARHPLRFDVFSDETEYYDAVSHNITVIGEAVNRLLKIDPGVPITAARDIVGMRNRVIHAYDNIRPEILWNIIVNHLPVLEKEARALLAPYLDSLAEEGEGGSERP